MLVAITGLHASGKSYFTNNIPSEYGFEVYDKKEIVKQICFKETNEEDYWAWYQQEYNNGPYKMTSKIISELPLEKNVFLDAVHSYEEWKTIKSILPDSIIVIVTTPEEIRATRWDEGDSVKDLKRIKYWHSSYNGEQGCLLTQVSWSFNGASSIETNKLCFEEMLKCYGIENYRNKSHVKMIERKSK